MPGISVPIFRVRNGPKEYIDKNQFNWLNTIFYLFFLGFEWPQNLALQYLPVGKWMRCVGVRVCSVLCWQQDPLRRSRVLTRCYVALTLSVVA